MLQFQFSFLDNVSRSGKSSDFGELDAQIDWFYTSHVFFLFFPTIALAIRVLVGFKREYR